LNALYRPDKMNCELIGNKVPHLHWHLIPRFSSDPAWPEPVWTKVHPPHRLPEAEMERLIEEIRGAL
jgi:diadenosine tetraphosphate (Ap4A) HIT family hydrolase